ncbi:oligosaccharide flippase family protein [Ectothiorhodospira haloalkaliphila]|uniref:oligosaccharide flippase family protein n=1 Tax=Ectothiorhodospira haloalkaliphila TaxID=421628 RepID=UPI001EE8DF1C|nr:oligosaccharide flippase family protein [Ectothiorhodospira haloalkaliphila]MCG5526253.1 oligosaccharide flippase family protein [Ectothiorhodospira haloalkaliphila]
MIRPLVLLAASGLAALMALAATVLVARTFGAAAFGFYATCLAAFALLAPLLSMGLGKLVLRRQVRDCSGEGAGLLRVGIPLILLAALGMAALFVGLGPVLFAVEPLWFLLMAAALPSLALQEPTKGVLQAHRRDLALAGWQLLQPGVRLAAVLAALAGAWGFSGYLVAFAVGEWTSVAVALLLATAFVRRTAASQAGALPRPRLRGALAEGAPFALSAVLYTVYYQSDIIMLSLLAGLEAAGQYKAAFVFLAGAYLLPSAFFQSYWLPRVFGWWEEAGGASVLRGVPLALAGCLAFGVPLALGLHLAAEPLVTTLYGPDYAEAARALRLLALAALFHFTAMALGVFLVTERGVRFKVWAQMLCAGVNIGANLWLIPVMGVQGAVVATLLTEALLATTYGLALWAALRPLNKRMPKRHTNP